MNTEICFDKRDQVIAKKNTMSRGQQGWPSPEYKQLKDHYAETKNVMHERVEFNEVKRAHGEDI